MSNVVRNRARREPRRANKERANELEQALAAAEATITETHGGIDEVLQYVYDAADILEALLPTEEDPPAEERERILRGKLEDLVVDAITYGQERAGEKCVEVMEAFEALPAVKWPEAPIGEELPEWMTGAILQGICACADSAGTEELLAAIAAELSQKGTENPGPQAVENAAPAEA